MDDPQHFEVIVIGCGGIGSGAVYWLSRRLGKGVLGLEQFKLGHEHGGSQDVSRIIRLMYHDRKYTKLAPETFKAWEEVELESGLKIFHKTGGIDFAAKGTPGEALLNKVKAALAIENIPFQNLTGPEMSQRFPTLTTGSDVVGIYQADAGIADAAVVNASHIQLARAHGATIIDECPVTRLETLKNGEVRVHTCKGTFQCKKVVVASGAWTNHVLGTLGVHIPMYVTQEQVTYYATPNLKEFTKDRFPVFICHGDKDFYGMGIHCNTGFKIGIHEGGPVVTAHTRDYNPCKVREELCTEFIRKYMPKAEGPILFTKTCLYAITPDKDFLIDTLSSVGLPQIAVVLGAGHGYKFASLLGKILSELAVDGRTKFDISGFKFDREALQNPSNRSAGLAHKAASKL